MTSREEIKRTLSTFFPLPNSNEHIVEDVEGQICINGYCYLPIKLSRYFERLNSITVFDENGDEIGNIYFSEITNFIEIISLNQLSFSSFLVEYPHEQIQDTLYKFQYDYILIKKDRIKDYLDNYKIKSSIWGGFFHIEDLPNNIFSKTKIYEQITAIKGVNIDRPFYFDTLELIVNEPNPFTRFLKLYHLIEMQFDMHTAIKINYLLSIPNKEKDISRTLKDYNREDIERLKSLFILKLNSSSLVPFLDNIIGFKIIADSIFYEYGKDSNPLKTKNQFDSIVSSGTFNQVNIDRILGNNRFNEIIPKLVAYWIYRVRSSIAHNKLGEYLMSIDDEEFVINFAEPLLREVVIQCYKT